MHHQSGRINEKLETLEHTFEETGTVRPDVTDDRCNEEMPTERGFDAPF
jgi:hypothetical protein